MSGIIDWDQSLWMPRAYEAARACAFMFIPERQPARAFVEAYRAVSGASREELEDGARAWGVFSDHLVWPVEQVCLHQNDNARRLLRRPPFRPFAAAWRDALD